MSHYKKDVASNRDALFGGGGGGGNSSRPSAPRASRPQQQQQRPATTSSSLSSVAKTTTSTPISSANFGYASADNNTDPTITPGPSKIFTTHGRLASKSVPLNLLTGTAKIDKMAEAEGMYCLSIMLYNSISTFSTNLSYIMLTYRLSSQGKKSHDTRYILQTRPNLRLQLLQTCRRCLQTMWRESSRTITSYSIR